MEEPDFLQNLKDGNKSAFNHLLFLYRDKVIYPLRMETYE